MYGYDSWTIKKAEHRRIDAFELWCWRRLLRVPWTAKEIQPVHRKGDQSWVFIGRTDAEAETPVVWPLMRRVDSLEKTLMLGGIGGRRRRGQQRMRCLVASLTRWAWVWVNSRSRWWTGKPGMLQSMGSQRVGHNWATELNWWQVKGLAVGVRERLGVGDFGGIELRLRLAIHADTEVASNHGLPDSSLSVQ